MDPEVANIWEGEFENNKLHGYGRWIQVFLNIDTDFRILTGYWSAGKYIGNVCDPETLDHFGASFRDDAHKVNQERRKAK